MFSSEDEFEAKVHYYLKNEALRRKIVAHAQRTRAKKVRLHKRMRGVEKGKQNS